MRKLLASTAIAAALAGFAFGAQAQSSDTQTTEPAASSAGEQAGTGTETMASAGDLCEAKWIVVDKDSDGFVSEEEATGAIASEFSQIDANGDGEITKTEYVDCIAANQTTAELRAETAAKRDEESFKAADANRDEAIDAEEFQKSAKQAFEESRSATDPEAEALVVLRRFVWVAPDELSSGGVQSMTADEAAARSAMTFANLDLNNDGKLDISEWSIETTARGMSQAWASTHFDDMDADSSSGVSKEEYASFRNAALDEMTTASTAASSDAGTDETASASASASDEAETGDPAGTPVFVYRFLVL